MIWTGAEEEEQARSSGRQKQEKKLGRTGTVALKEAQQKFSNKIRHTKRSSRWQHRSLRQEEQSKARAEKEGGKEEMREWGEAGNVCQSCAK